MIVPPRSSSVSDGRALRGDLAGGDLVVEHLLPTARTKPRSLEQLRRLFFGEATQLGHSPRLRAVGHDQLTSAPGSTLPPSGTPSTLDEMTVPAGTSSLNSVSRLGGDELEALDLGFGVGQRQPAEIGNAAELRPFGDDDEQRRPFGEVLARRRRRQIT